MRIAYIIPSFCPADGGEQRDAYDAATGLAELGCRVTVFTSCAEPNSGMLQENMRVVVLSQPRISRHLRHWFFLRAVRKAIASNGPWDIVQGFCRSAVGNVYRSGGGTHRAYQSRVSPYSSRLQLLAAVFGPKNYYYRHLEDINFTRRDVLFLANSRGTKEEIRHGYGLSEEQLRVVYPGVDVDVFSPAAVEKLRKTRRHFFAVPPGNTAIAFIGSNYFRKGLSCALQACAQLKQQGIGNTLLVAGKGPAARYRSQAKRLGIVEDVRFLGPCQNTLDVLAAADLFVLPSLYEPYGLAPLEAMACGIPVVITKCCGLAERLVHGREGFLLDRPDDANQAADFLKLLATNPALRREMGHNARRSAASLDKKRYCRELFDLYSAW